MSKSSFTERDATEILKRAARLQERAATDAHGEAGIISLEQLEKIAAEAGIDPMFLEAAIEGPSSDEAPAAFGLGRVFQRTFDYELSQAQIRDALDDLETDYTIRALPYIGRIVKFHVAKGFVFAHCEVSARNGKTTLRIKQVPFTSYFAGLHGPLILGFVLGINLIVNGLAVLGAVLMSMILTLGLVLFVLFSNFGKQQARKMADVIAAPIAEAVAKARTSGPHPATAPAFEEESGQLQSRA